jgi:hypothetical protein
MPSALPTQRGWVARRGLASWSGSGRSSSRSTRRHGCHVPVCRQRASIRGVGAWAGQERPTIANGSDLSRALVQGPPGVSRTGSKISAARMPVAPVRVSGTRDPSAYG